MKTNNPPIAAWAPGTALAKLASRHNNAPCVLTDGPAEFNDVALIRLSDYERLQAECEELKRALAESRANDLTAMGYLNQIRGLVGAADLPDMVRRCEKLRAECERLRAAMIEAKGHISHYMYGGSSYREPAVAAIELIDDALQEAT